MATPKVYRDASRRLHCAIANHFAIRAWVNRADCIVLSRKVLEPLLDLERFRESRLDQMKADMKRWFPYIHELYSATGPKKNQVAVVFLSRVPIGEYTEDSMPTRKRIERMAASGIKAILFNDPADVPASEQELLSESVLWASGLDVPPKKKKKFARASARS